MPDSEFHFADRQVLQHAGRHRLLREFQRRQVLIQDVAQPDQSGIVLNNWETFRFKDALLSIKARSINSVKDPAKVFRTEVDKLRGKFHILQEVDLQPYEEDHILVNLKAK